MRSCWSNEEGEKRFDRRSYQGQDRVDIARLDQKRASIRMEFHIWRGSYLESAYLKKEVTAVDAYLAGGMSEVGGQKSLPLTAQNL